MNATRFGFRMQQLLQSNSSNGMAGFASRGLLNRSTSMQVWNRVEFYSTQKKSKVPIAFSSLETMLTGRGMTISPPKKEDKSAYVGFISPPQGHQDKKDIAQKYGVQNWYSMEQSVYTLHFDDETATSSTIGEYTDERRSRFLMKYPHGRFYPVSLDSMVTSHFERKGIPHSTAIFDQHALEYRRNEGWVQPLPYMTLFLKTPGGFWRLNWHSTLENLKKRNADFIKTVKDLKVILREDEQENDVKPPEDKTTVTKQQLL